jgi:hypothetical protein
VIAGNIIVFNALRLAMRLHDDLCMLRVQRFEDEKLATFALSGRIEEQHVDGLQELFGTEGVIADISFDLEEVRLVDREAVRFLANCEARGIRLRNCPSYIREWIEQGAVQGYEP